MVMVVGLSFVQAHGQPGKSPPKTRMDNVKELIHGVEVIDPYRWLEDQDSPETREWVEAQNNYTDSVIGSLPFREAIKRRLTELMRIDWIGMPIVRNGRYFFSKRERDQELPVICMREGLDGKDEVLIDPHSMSPDRTTSVGILDVSEDGKLMAYSVRQGGEDEVSIRLLDVDEKKDLPDGLPKRLYFDCCLKHDKSGLYYSKHDSGGPRVCYHAAGTDPAGDVEIFGKGYAPDKGISIELSEDGRFLLMTVWHGSAGQKSEVYFKDIGKDTPIVSVVNDIDARFLGSIGGEFLFLLTNWEAPKERIFRVSLADPARHRWREIVPEADAVIERFSLVGRRLIVTYLRNVSSEVKVVDPDGGRLGEVSLPGIGSVGGVAGRWKSNEAFFSFSSFNAPTTAYRYDVEKGTQEVWWRSSVPIESEALQVKQVWCKSKDGTKVPMFLVHGRDLRLGGKNPTFLTGYGGFNVSLTPWFSALAAAWVEKGGVFAVANLRGGGEFGEDWHRAGMFEKKQNVFEDFIAAAEWLIANGYTEPAKLAISGGSNGGLLVGAAMTQRPELFGAVVCSYPLLDMVRYHRFQLAAFWVSEYGSSENPDQFPYIYAYSPYHKVKDGVKYPAVLFITGEADTRVDPLHARKMAARLRSAMGSEKPVLLRYHTKAGHSGGQPLGKQIEDVTDELSFLFWQLGVTFSPSLSSSCAPDRTAD